jgi:hypothetical protein
MEETFALHTKLIMGKKCQYSVCLNSVWSGGYCQRHQYIRRDKIFEPAKKKTKPIPKFSKKTRIKIGEYSTLRKDFLEAHPLCMAKLEECTRIATDIHHKQGRGKFFLVIKTWLGVCRNCHHWIENHPKEAKELGLSDSRLKN